MEQDCKSAKESTGRVSYSSQLLLCLTKFIKTSTVRKLWRRWKKESNLDPEAGTRWSKSVRTIITSSCVYAFIQNTCKIHTICTSEDALETCDRSTTQSTLWFTDRRLGHHDRDWGPETYVAWSLGWPAPPVFVSAGVWVGGLHGDRGEETKQSVMFQRERSKNCSEGLLSS